MLYRFDRFELDLDKAELRLENVDVHLEPQVYAVLALLVQNHERVVSKDEMIDKVWGGRFISDSAVSSRIKSLRHALGDNGSEQHFIKTVHARGFRFVAEVQLTNIARKAAHAFPSNPVPLDGEKPSIAVLPFMVLGDPGPYGVIGRALPHELIAAMSRMRWLEIIARGSSFQLGTSGQTVEKIAQLLAVRYCLAGIVEFSGSRLMITVELTDSRCSKIIWADRFEGCIDDVHSIRETICSRVVTALEIAIPLHEADTARIGATENLDAWSAYHLGLQHMFRFNQQDNAKADALFQTAIAKDPDFSRAHAGLSFVHFQTAFLKHTDDLGFEVKLARQFAERAMECDPIDPFANFAMGRSYWLEGDLNSSIGWLERSTQISPNYAQGIYARGWTEALSGCGDKARSNVDLAMRLSPLDPLYYAMLGARSLSYLVEGDDEQAALWAHKAALAPGAHVLIAMIAIVTHALAGDSEGASKWAANVRHRNDMLTRNDFFRSFPIQSSDVRTRAATAFETYGF